MGSGPASLACAGRLAAAGHDAVIYEKAAIPGGLDVSGIAPYKLDAKSALRDVDFVRALGVTIHCGVEVGREVTPAELLARHDAVFLGIGLGADTALGVPGEVGAGVVGATAFVRALKLEPGFVLGPVRRAAVIGGGNTALDIVRELRGLGVPEVTLVYRRAEGSLRGYRHEWAAAKAEGVRLIEYAAVTTVVRAADRPVALRLVRTEDGRPTAAALPELPVDLVVVAIGQGREAALARSFPRVTVDARGLIVVDPATGATANPRIFAGGDAVNGGKEVVNAVDEGQRAARAIDARLAALAKS